MPDYIWNNKLWDLKTISNEKAANSALRKGVNQIFDNPGGVMLDCRKFSVEEILERDKTSLDIFWIKDKSLADLDNLPSPDELAGDIIENLQSALDSFKE